jgi:hypothetical protein
MPKKPKPQAAPNKVDPINEKWKTLAGISSVFWLLWGSELAILIIIPSVASAHMYVLASIHFVLGFVYMVRLFTRRCKVPVLAVHPFFQAILALCALVSSVTSLVLYITDRIPCDTDDCGKDNTWNRTRQYGVFLTCVGFFTSILHFVVSISLYRAYRAKLLTSYTSVV